MATALAFLFDFVSPYAYLASTQIRALAARHGRDVEPVPVLFAGMLDATGARGPAEIPAKRAYLFRHVIRLAAQLGVPIEAPATHPFNPLVALRAAGCVAEPDARFGLVEALFRAAWVERRRIDQPEIVREVADAIGLDGAVLLERAATPEAKLRLRTTTDGAIARGVFGVPTVEVDAELFWGTDALPLLERALRGDDPITPARLAPWLSLTPSATRPGSV